MLDSDRPPLNFETFEAWLRWIPQHVNIGIGADYEKCPVANWLRAYHYDAPIVDIDKYSYLDGIREDDCFGGPLDKRLQLFVVIIDKTHPNMPVPVTFAMNVVRMIRRSIDSGELEV